MQFSYLLSAFLETLTVASPVANPETKAVVAARDDLYEGAGALLESRAKGDTKPYEFLSQVHSDLKDKEWYAFTQKFPLGKDFPHHDKERNDVQKLQAKLGYAHIELVTGQVREKKSNKVVKRDFTESKPWGYMSDYDANNFGFVKQTTKAKIDGLKDFNAKYEKEHKKYSVDTNNCLSYVNAAKNAL